MAVEQFLWGAVTAGYKVEGGNVHHPLFRQLGAAADHWRQWPADVAIIKSLGLTAYCLYMDWTRLEPSRGQFNEAAMQHYRDMLLELQRLGIKVLLGLQAGPYPAWFTDSGAWRQAENVAAWRDYADYAARQLGDAVFGWIILPAEATHEAGNWLHRVEMKVRLQQVRAQAAKAIRAAGPVAYIEGYDFICWDMRTVATDDLDKTLRHQRLSHKPIYIIDAQPDFLRERLRAIEAAQAAGVNIRGYFTDSLLDGIEDTGLVAVDLATQARHIRPAAYVYKAIIHQALGN